MSLTAAVREELAHVPVPPAHCRLAETAAVLRLGGALHLAPDRGGVRLSHVVVTDTGAVARRLHASLVALVGLRPEIEVHAPGPLTATTTYRVRLAADDEAGQGRLRAALRRLGVLDARGHPAERLPAALTRRDCDAVAAVRGALLVAGSVSDPAGAPHLEVRTPGEASARAFADLVARCGASGAKALPGGDGWRVVVKSGAAIGTLLARVGAHGAFLRWDEGRLRAELRGQANRAANADRANVSRAVAASGRQVAAIEAALAVLDWHEVPEELRQVALARLANPEASLAEIGALCVPPVGKATVHRRLARLSALAAAARERSGTGTGTG